jgi:hypothetical protein
MYPDNRLNITRVWWDGNEVAFIRWTEKSLVFAWPNAYETAIHIPRGAVLRLVQKGILHIEGNMPNWMPGAIWELPTGIKMTADQPAVIEDPQPSPAQASAPQHEVALPQAEAPKPDQRSARYSAISRLIRKLTGGERVPAEAGS